MDTSEFREIIVRPALKITEMWSSAAENLLVGTALVESNLDSLVQKGGPAKGVYQIEPFTHQDIKRYISTPFKKNNLFEKITSACYSAILLPDDALIWHLRYATLIARVIYWRRPEPLPDADNIRELADYWVEFYNAGGKGEADRFVDVYREAHNEGKHRG